MNEHFVVFRKKVINKLTAEKFWTMDVHPIALSKILLGGIFAGVMVCEGVYYVLYITDGFHSLCVIMYMANDFFEGDNIGGLRSVEIVHVDDIEGWAPVLLKNGKQWRALSFHPNGASFKDDVNESEHGIYYVYAGSIRVHRRNRATELILDQYLGQVSVLRITDNNGYTIVIGSKEHPVQLTRRGDTGAGPADMNHYVYSFSVSQLERALYG